MPSGSARVSQHGEGLRQRVGVDDEDRVGLRAAGPADQRHRLGGGGRLVEHRGAGDVEPGEVGDHGLEVDQRLEPALADLGLVGRVGGVPGRVLQHVALDDRGRDRAVVPQPDHRGVDVVGGGALAQLRPGPRPRPAAAGRSSGVRSRTPSGTQASTSDVEGRVADGREHLGGVAGARARCAGRRRTRRGPGTSARAAARSSGGRVAPAPLPATSCAAGRTIAGDATSAPAQRPRAPADDGARSGQLDGAGTPRPRAHGGDGSDRGARRRRRIDSSSSAGVHRAAVDPLGRAARRARRRARAAHRRRRCRRRPGRRRAGRRPPRPRCTRRRWRRRRSSVTLARSLMPRLRRWSTALRMFCSETPVSSSRLTTLSTRMSRKEYSRCVPEPVAVRTEGATRPVRAQ